MSAFLQQLKYRLSFTIEKLMYRDAPAAARFIERNETISATETNALRDELFRKLIAHVYQNVPYYQRVMKERGLTPSSFKTIADINLLPPLTKEIIRQEKDNLLATNIPESETISGRSGGTTGEPIVTVLNQHAHYIEYFAMWRGYRWMGLKPGMGLVKLFGGSLGVGASGTFKNKIKKYLLNQIFVPAFEMNEQNIGNYVNTINNHGKSVLMAYASALYNFALLVEKAGIDPPALVAAFSTAEQMTEEWTEKINTVLKCPVVSFYGCGEINSLGFQMQQGGPYKIPQDHVYVESIHMQGLPDHTLAITALHNYAKPLIRYVNGDVGTVEKASDGFEYITQLIGRADDMLVRKDGTYIAPSLARHAILVTKTPVRKYQVIQTDYDVIEFRYEPEFDKLDESYIQKLKTAYENQFGYPITMKAIQTSEFLLSPSMKHRIVMNKTGKK